MIRLNLVYHNNNIHRKSSDIVPYSNYFVFLESSIYSQIKSAIAIKKFGTPVCIVKLRQLQLTKSLLIVSFLRSLKANAPIFKGQEKMLEWILERIDMEYEVKVLNKLFWQNTGRASVNIIITRKYKYVNFLFFLLLNYCSQTIFSLTNWGDNIENRVRCVYKMDTNNNNTKMKWKK